jgi:hypothetical protein
LKKFLFIAIPVLIVLMVILVTAALMTAPKNRAAQAHAPEMTATQTPAAGEVLSDSQTADESQAIATETEIATVEPTATPTATATRPAPTPTATLLPAQQAQVPVISAALNNAISGREDVLAFLIHEIKIDSIKFSADGNLSLVWFALVDPDTKQIIPGEPGLAIARLIGDIESGLASWQITLQADSNWSEQLAKVPADLISDEIRAQYTADQQKMAHDGLVFSGYKLPWEGGKSKWITNTIGHVLIYKSCPSTCLYAYDFADGSMFPILAAKSGTVKYAKWEYPNGNETNTNYLVLEDTSTTPTTYQLYYHLAQDSIPEKFRVKGAQVLQGEFIGNADDTGASTGHHLHFHVHSNPNVVFGTSVDITFDDVTDNGGRPRTCKEASQFPEYGRQCQTGNLYTSGNGDMQPPTGGIGAPAAGTVVSARTVSISGWGKDDQGVASTQLMVMVNGTWTPVGEEFKKDTFKTTLDVCALNLPEGEFFVSVGVVDASGKTNDLEASKRKLVKNFSCTAVTPTPAPDCKPEGGQAAVFADPLYAGACQVFDIGTYMMADLLVVGNDNIESVKLGEGTTVTLFADNEFAGARERLTVSDVNLGDNLIGANKTSSLKVEGQVAAPEKPQLYPVLNDNLESPSDQDRLTLSWARVTGAEEYRSELIGVSGVSYFLDWQAENTWTVGKLPAGRYMWSVEARNYSGTSQDTIEFNVVEYDFAPGSHMLALNPESNSTGILLKWVLDEGARDINAFDIQYRKDGGDWLDWSRPANGDQRQMWFYGDMGGLYEFRMRAVDRKGAKEAYPEEPEAFVTIEAACEPDSYEGYGDDKFDGPAPAEIGEVQIHNICSVGDEDWLIFPAAADTAYRINVTPLDGTGAIRARVYAAKDLWLLAEQVPSGPGEETRLEWKAPEENLYFLRLSALDPRLGGSGVKYRVTVEPAGTIPGEVFFSGLFLPILWFLVKRYTSWRLNSRATL